MIKKCVYSLFLTMILCVTNASGYDDKVTHPALTANSMTLQFDQYLKSVLGLPLGIKSELIAGNEKQSIQNWLEQGSTAEDKPMCRASNHFHNPLLPWNASQMSDDTTWLASAIRLYCNNSGWPYIYRKSNVTWATGYLSPAPDGLKYMFLSSETSLPVNWDTARASYYSALTAKGQANRDADLAATFSALGHVLHLVQDMAVPAHVRNDFQSHLEVTDENAPNPIDRYYNPFEWYVKNHTTLISNSTITPSFANTRLTDFWDTDKYNGSNPSTLTDIGLAEYANANYFSNYTIPNNGTTPEHTFPYPHLGGANSSGPNYQICSYQFMGGVASVNYVSRTTKGSCPSTPRDADHFAVASLMNLPGASDINSISHVWLPPEVHEQYAKDLLPRAVGYSAALLDYFFRGTLDVSWPETAVYSIADGSQKPYPDNGNQHQQFTTIKAAVLGLTNEVIGAGELRAVAKYKIIPNYSPDLSNYPPDGMTMKAVTEYSYSVSTPRPLTQEEVASINVQYTEFTFDFSSAPIPAGITDLTLQVVFKGTIGNEIDNAIAVGMIDLMEPTHLTIWNLTDMFPVRYPGSEINLYTFDTLESMVHLPEHSSLLTKLDLTKDGKLNDELDLKPSTSSTTISFWEIMTQEWKSATTVAIPAGGHIRLILLVDRKANNYAKVEWVDQVDPGNPGSREITFPGVVNQANQNGNYPTPTAVYPFRGQPLVPSRQHYYYGHVNCLIGDVYAGSCPYPYEKSDPVSLTPVPFTSAFK